MLVTIDGPSGIGKSTLVPIVVTKLEQLSIEAITTSTPSKSVIGQLARSGTYKFGSHALACLVAADRYLHDSELVRPAMAKGCVVVCDRYVASALVLNQLDGVAESFTWEMYKPISIPAISVVLLGDPKVSLIRASERGHYSRFHTQELTRATEEVDLYRKAADFLSRQAHFVYTIMVDGKTPDEVAEEIVGTILQRRSEER